VEIVELTLSVQKYKTKVVLKGGTKPDFKNQTKVFDIANTDGTKVKFSVFDKEIMGTDDFVGDGTFDLKDLKNY
jgi:Ca2+-dependent lipid-binding protein